MLTPDILAQAGRMLHGDEFVAPLARDLHLGERSLQRMLAGTRPIPEGIGAELLALIDAKRDAIAQAIQGENPIPLESRDSVQF